MSKGLGKVEWSVLIGISKVPEYIKEGVYCPYLFEGRGTYYLDTDKSLISDGRYVHTDFLWWWFKGQTIHRSTLSRTLKSLEDKGLIRARNYAACEMNDSFFNGKYRKFIFLTDEGHNIVNANIFQWRKLAHIEVTL